ncbi:CheR family methyltransferase [Gymnodinialimonas ceratoperidinii]|uniref:Chemotaxis protein methyltransferase n=1 Tax=Gymnodinialimonas ceratoperidinii TaxID=2856823 RepID=A0A8F6TYD5_9RHOB|nr:protein-glutamate O-methyltransferase [Gymnodinialimonas ceratoperidinii]QXT41187.1 protein-glutamate O-methyltransferase [Gymnodinialimonas ceratoperidinii]
MTLLQPEADRRQNEISDLAFSYLATALQEETGIVLTAVKRELVVSRLSRRLRALDLPDFDAYCDLLAGPDGAVELNEMLLLLTTNVTRFFREPHHLERLRQDILPDLINKARAGERVRIWSAGCSSGEEAYSLAMILLDLCPEARSMDIRILATDIDRNVIEAAKRGLYRFDEHELLADPLIQKYTTPTEAGAFQVNPDVKSIVKFACLNLQKPWPMNGKFDVIFCRNVVIYFAAQTQQHLWPRFANALHEGGHLMIGHSERITGAACAYFKPVGTTHYQLVSRGNAP